jgi:hypothetical protein
MDVSKNNWQGLHVSKFTCGAYTGIARIVGFYAKKGLEVRSVPSTAPSEYARWAMNG